MAAIAAMVIGYLWYSPMFFGKRWMKEMGMTAMGEKKGMGMTYIIMYIASAITAYVLYHVFAVGGYALATPYRITFLLWLGFIAMPLLNGVYFEKKSWTLYFINAGYHLVTLLVMAFIFTLWA